jgi:hypothetical protein
VKYWEITADNLKKRGWSLGWVSALDSCGRTIWIVDAHRDDGRRFVVHADERLTAFIELERVIRESLRFPSWIIQHDFSLTLLLLDSPQVNRRIRRNNSNYISLGDIAAASTADS